MITESTRKKLKKAAIENNLGGDNTLNVDYSNLEIDNLFKKYINNIKNNLSLKSVFNDKLYESEKSWKNDISRNMNKKSRILLFFKISQYLYGNIYCFHCEYKFIFDDFNYHPRFKNNGGFPKYCKKCTVNYAWSKHADYKNRGKKISISKKQFFQTKKGKSIAKIVGEKNSIKMKEYLQTDKGKESMKRRAEKNSKTMKRKIASGEFTPTITNSWTHWDAIIYINDEQKKFRSSWEACFWFSNQYLEFEKIRIPYISIDGDKKIYIADFYDASNKIIYEIKPKSSFLIQQHKMDSIIQYCIDNNIDFNWINEYNILDYIDETIFYDKNKLQLDKMKLGIKI